MTNSSWNAISLKSLPVADRANSVPDFLKRIIAAACDDLNVMNIWIYGSRARGDNEPTSDYDLAFEIPSDKITKWVPFKLHFEEAANTLLEIDLVDIGSVDSELKKSILTEGVLLYER